MAFTPISNDFIQYSATSSGTSAAGYFLKLYAAGTNTPISTALDSAGSTLVAKTELDSLGFAQNGSGGATTLYIDQAYRLVLYVNAADADSNTFINAVQDIDDIPQIATLNSDGSLIKSFATLAAAVADTNLLDGDALNIAERTTGNGGGAMWDVVLSSTVTENTFNIVQGVGVGTLSLVLRINGETNVRSWGAVGDGVTNDAVSLQSIFDFLDTIGGGNVYFPIGTYMISASEGVRIGPDTVIHGVKGGSILKRIAATGSKIILVAFNYAVGGVAPSQPIANVTVRDLSFDGDAGAAGTNDSQFLHGLDIRLSQKVLVENCEFKDCPGDGIIVRHQCQDVTIINNTFDGSVGWARTRSQFPTAATVRNAISVLGVDKITIQHNTILDWGLAAAIDFEQDDSSLGDLNNVIIDGNHMTSSTLHFRGIQIAPQPGGLTTDRLGKNIRVTNNTVEKTSDFAIFIEPRTTTGAILYEDVLVKDNTIKTTFTSIVCNGVSRLNISGNAISAVTSNPNARAVRILDCRDGTTITNNIIGQSNFTKIEVNNNESTAAKGLSISANIIIDTQATSGSGIDVNGFFQDAVISSNTINTKVTGIQIRGTSATEFTNSSVTGNIITTEGFGIFTADWCKHTMIDSNQIQYTLISGGAILDSVNLAAGGGINFGDNTFVDETGVKVEYTDFALSLNRINNHRMPMFNDGTQDITLASTALSTLTPYVRVAAGGFSVNSIGSLNRVITIIANGALTITHNATTLKLNGGVSAVMADGEAITLIRKPDLNLVELSRSF